MSPYFDRTYFDGAYFDVDAAPVASGRSAAKAPRPLRLVMPVEPVLAEDEELLTWIT